MWPQNDRLPIALLLNLKETYAEEYNFQRIT